jgi:hypothetical protein
MKVIIQVFLILFGALPIVMTLGGGVEGAYKTFIEGYQEVRFFWLLLCGGFFTGFFWVWNDYKKGKL